MNALKTQLPQAVALRHEDLYTAGIPDLSVTLAGRSSWWEIKYADPWFKTSKIQQHICTRLAECGVCWYVIFQRGIPRKKNPRQRQIRVVKPSEIEYWQHCGKVISDGVFDHAALVRYIHAVHERPSVMLGDFP